MGAQENQYLMGELNRNGQADMAQRMEAAKQRRFGPQVKAFVERYPDAPPLNDYDYYQMAFEGKLPDPAKLTPEQGMVFLPEEGYRTPRDNKWMLGKPISFDVNSGTYQYPQPMGRVVARGVRGAAKTGLGVLAQTSPMVQLGLVSKEEFVNTLLPEGLDELQTNYASTPGAALEGLGAVITEMGIDMLAARAGGFKFTGTKPAMSFKPTTFRRWANGLAGRVEDAASPGVVAGESLFLLNEENLQAETMTELAVTGLREMGFDGEVLDELEKLPNNPAVHWALNVMEGAALWEVARFVPVSIGKVLRKRAALIYATAAAGLAGDTTEKEPTDG